MGVSYALVYIEMILWIDLLMNGKYMLSYAHGVYRHHLFLEFIVIHLYNSLVLQHLEGGKYVEYGFHTLALT